MRTALLWVALTSIGWAAAALVSGLVIGGLARPVAGLLWGIPYVALLGAVFGLVVGAVQLPLVARRGAWIVATAVGTAVGFVLAAVVGELLGNVIDPLTPLVVGEGAIEDTSGALLGLAIAYAQWRVLRGTMWWVVAGAVGAALGYGTAAAVLELFEIEILRANLIPAFGAIVGLFVGVAQAIVIRARRMQHL